MTPALNAAQIWAAALNSAALSAHVRKVVEKPNFFGKSQREALLLEAAKRIATGWTPIATDTAQSVVGEGVHTGLRKGGEAADAMTIWRAISNSKTSAWSDACAFFIDGLEVMGLAICQKRVDE